jgi:hypothetical protein
MSGPSRARQLVAPAYVLTVGAIATFGFTTESTAAILLAGLLALPTSVPAVIGFYCVVGMLAQIPGANPDSASGSVSCSPEGVCHGSVTGEAATWFMQTTEIAGIVALTTAAVLNVAILRLLTAGRRGRTRTPTRPRRASSA